jgi:hypothetical protein
MWTQWPVLPIKASMGLPIELMEVARATHAELWFFCRPSNKSRDRCDESVIRCPKCSRLLLKNHAHWRGKGAWPHQWILDIAWALPTTSLIQSIHPWATVTIVNSWDRTLPPQIGRAGGSKAEWTKARRYRQYRPWSGQTILPRSQSGSQ